MAVGRSGLAPHAPYTVGDETLSKPFKAFREKIVSGEAGGTPKGAAPKAATDAKKGA